jgi:hypothetical protein
MVSAKPKLSLTVALGRTELVRREGSGGAVTEEFGLQGWVFAGLAFIYGLMIMTLVIVTLAKSARLKGHKRENGG